MLDNEFEIKINKEESGSHKRKSLGRGLGALLGDDNLEEEISLMENHSGSTPSMIDVSLIKPSRFQPRTEFDEEALKALSQSIKDKGVLQPLLVRKTDNGYELIAGERRWRAAQLAGLNKVPVIEKELKDQEALEVALVENLLRENLSAIEEAEALQRLMDEFSHTQEALSQVIGKSRSYIANTLRLLNLPESIKNFVKEGKLTAGHARQLIGLDNAEQLAEQIIKKDMSVRQVEELVAKQKTNKPEQKKKTISEDVADIEKSLNKTLGLRIKISPSKQGGGKVVLQYASPAELDMIIDILEQKRNVQNTVTVAPAMVQASAPAAPVSNEKFSIKIVD